MLSIPFVSIESQDWHSEERAKEALDHYEARDAARAESYKAEGIILPPSSLVSRGVAGSVLFTMRFSTTSGYEIEELFAGERTIKRSQDLMQGRKTLPPHNGGEEANGLLDGLFDA